MRRMELFTHPTLDQLHQLGLAGMARAFAELEANPTSAALSHAEWLVLLLDREITERYERRLRARLRFARLRHQAAVEDVDYRAAIGILRLARHYGADRLEAACERGLDIGARSYGSIQSILKHGLDRRPPPARQGELLPDHSNIRGPRYYH